MTTIKEQFKMAIVLRLLKTGIKVGYRLAESKFTNVNFITDKELEKEAYAHAESLFRSEFSHVESPIELTEVIN